MSIKTKGRVRLVGAGQVHDTEYGDVPIELRESTVNGYTFHWGPNEIRNFLDDGVGAAHASFKSGTDTIIEETITTGSSRS